jgi:hypothetical protein
MVSPVVHRKWAREYLARAERAPKRNLKRRYLRLAVSNTVCAHRLEAHVPAAAEEQEKNGSAVNRLTQKH